MVRRVGFGDTPAPEKRRAISKPAVKDMRPKPSDQVAKAQKPPKAEAVSKVSEINPVTLVFKTLKIVTTIAIAVQVDSNIVKVIMIWWAGKEIYSIFRKKPIATDAKQ